MQILIRYFFRGLLVFVPAVATVAIVVFVFTRVDRWMGLPIPGVGFAATLVLILVLGALASNIVTKRLLELVDTLFRRLPFVQLVYTAIRDLTSAIVGEKKGFDHPVAVALWEGSGARALGFATRESLEAIGMPGYVAVYLPQSYNFAGMVLVFPREKVLPLTASSSDVMSFVVSGGVAGLAAPPLAAEPLSSPAGPA